MNVNPHFFEDDVRQALSAMRRGESQKDNPLCSFMIVRILLDNPYALPGAVAVDVAISHLLTRKIIDRLGDIRALSSIPAPDVACTEFHLLADFDQGHDELEAWSTLYHHYVCLDRHLSMPTLADLTGVPDRTLNRRRQLGIHRLAAALAKDEQTVRREETHRRLVLALPHCHEQQLFGRESHFATALHCLTGAEAPHHLVLHGPTGIGKTMLAQTLAQHLIAGSTLSDLLWIDVSAINADYLIEEIATRLGIAIPDNAIPATALKAYVYNHRTLIVLDDADRLIADFAGCKSLLDVLSAAQVILASNALPDNRLWAYSLTLSELDREHSFALLDSVADRSNIGGTAQNLYDTIWQVAGGNPLMLELALQAAREKPLKQTTIEFVQIFDQIWTQLAPVERKLWVLPLLCFKNGITFELARELSGLDARNMEQGVGALVGQSLLFAKPFGDTVNYTLRSASHTFLRQQLNNLRIDTQLPVSVYLHAALERYLPQVDNAAQSICLLNLGLDLPISFVDCRRYAELVMPVVTREGLWPAWAGVLNRLHTTGAVDPDRIWVYQQMGIAQRWLGQLDEARQHLDQALAYYTNADDDLGRAGCLIELVVIHRYQARWREAQQLANDALDIFRKFEVADGIERAIHEMAQLALERHQPARAIGTLEQLTHWSARTWGIAGQAYLQLDQYQEALAATQEALDLQPIVHPNRGRAMATQGQIYYAMNRPEKAVNILWNAMHLLDDAKDSFGYARVCSNLAVAYFDQADTGETQFDNEEIRELLVQAAQTQEFIGDEIGLAVTRRNLSWFFSSDHE